MFALPFNCNIISSNHLLISYFALTLVTTIHVQACHESVEKGLNYLVIVILEQKEKKRLICQFLTEPAEKFKN